MIQELHCKVENSFSPSCRCWLKSVWSEHFCDVKRKTQLLMRKTNVLHQYKSGWAPTLPIFCDMSPFFKNQMKNQQYFHSFFHRNMKFFCFRFFFPPHYVYFIHASPKLCPQKVRVGEPASATAMHVCPVLSLKGYFFFYYSGPNIVTFPNVFQLQVTNGACLEIRKSCLFSDSFRRGSDHPISGRSLDAQAEGKRYNRRFVKSNVLWGPNVKTRMWIFKTRFAIVGMEPWGVS